MKNLIKTTFALIMILTSAALKGQALPQKPVRIAVAGMTHDHIGFILNKKNKTYMKIVGICEPNSELAEKYA